MAAITRHSSSGGFLRVFDRATHYPIFRSFCSCLSITEIVSLTRTCKSLSGLYRYLRPRRWDVDKGLRRYFDNPQCFRSQMAKCDALLVGRFAEQYFMGTFWGSKRLDIIVQRGSSQLIGDYLPKKAGYRYIETSGPIQTSLNIQVRLR